MSRLINAGFARLFKNKVFYVIVIFSAVFGILQGTPGALDKMDGATFYIDSQFISFAIVSGVISACFTGLFLGTEYSDGTVRNKLIVGHGRLDIYISNLAVCCAANLIFIAVYYISVLIAALPQGGKFMTDGKILVLYAICGVMISVAFTAVMVFLGSAIGSRSRCVVACFVLAIGLAFASAYINGRLQEPETYDRYITAANGEFSAVETVPNPGYVEGAARKALETSLEILPSGQATILVSTLSIGDTPVEEADALYKWMGYSALFAAVFTAMGIGVFRRKDIK